MEMEELAQAEKEARRARLKTRMLWVLIVLDVLLFGYCCLYVDMVARP